MNAKTNTAQSLTNQIARQKEDIEYSWWSLFSWLHCQRTLLVKAPQSHTGHTILQHKWNKPYLWMDSVNLMPSSWRETQRRTLARNMDDHITVCPLPAENAWQLSCHVLKESRCHDYLANMASDNDVHVKWRTSLRKPRTFYEREARKYARKKWISAPWKTLC